MGCNVHVDFMQPNLPIKMAKYTLCTPINLKICKLIESSSQRVHSHALCKRPFANRGKYVCAVNSCHHKPVSFGWLELELDLQPILHFCPINFFLPICFQNEAKDGRISKHNPISLYSSLLTHETKICKIELLGASVDISQFLMTSPFQDRGRC